jgi:hypothetical protein
VTNEAVRSFSLVTLAGLRIIQVKHIRELEGNSFSVAVAGYPEGHPDVIGESGRISEEAYQKDLAYLKQKVKAVHSELVWNVSPQKRKQSVNMRWIILFDARN